MKIKVSMMDVLDMMHKLEEQNNEVSHEALTTLKDIFAPLLEECSDCLCPPTYELDASDSTSISNSTSEIDWEQRRYEIAKSAMQAYITHGNYDKNAIARMAVQDADKLIAKLKQ